MKAFKLITDPQAFQLLGDETRRRVIYLLRAKEMTVSQIAGELNLTPQAIYHHIRKLRDAGMVEVALLARDLDHAGVAQLPDMMVDRLRGQVQFSRDLAHGHLLGPQQVDDSSTRLVSEELERLGIRNEFECLHANLGTTYVCGCS